jgi:hypothetical protein
VQAVRHAALKRSELSPPAVLCCVGRDSRRAGLGRSNAVDVVMRRLEMRTAP